MLIAAALCLWPAVPAQPAPAAPPASQSPAAAARRIDLLIARLGDRDYTVRETAARELESLGDQAVEPLLAHLDHSDPEVLRRVEAILPVPNDPPLRLRAAVRLFETCRPEAIEKAVWMLFADAETVYEPFAKACRADPRLGRMGRPVLDEMDLWIQHRRIMVERIEKMEPQTAARFRADMEEIRRGRATAAFWFAIDAASSLERPPATRPSASQPP